MKTNVALIGFMGTGKSTVGKILAEKLNKRFVETDSIIEQQAGKSIKQIFEQDGEIHFREMEIDVIKKITVNSDQVIACGGGVVLNKININRLKESSRLVYLTASPLEIFKRTTRDDSRPLLPNSDRLSNIRELLKFRKPFYERAADITINTNRANPLKITGEIEQKLKEDAGFHF